MKFLHLADLHIGKRYNEFSLIEDQKYILDEVLKIVGGEQPDGVIIAGDVYDKSVPSAEAVELFDRFLNALTERGAQVFVISGNHDSAERIAFGAKLMSRSGVHFSPVYAGSI
ncbi:MAG: exonuclease subunit SbcD, partial [Clostridia bacterium]|nr:exonuclease subunit SbcD [Clostridia bacterium]